MKPQRHKDTKEDEICPREKRGVIMVRVKGGSSSRIDYCFVKPQSYHLERMGDDALFPNCDKS